jgi:hypothetical protein
MAPTSGTSAEGRRMKPTGGYRAHGQAQVVVAGGQASEIERLVDPRLFAVVGHARTHNLFWL